MSVSSTPAAAELRFDATADVRSALAQLGRTEDLRFSPDGRRLAFACYSKSQIAIADVDIDDGASGLAIGVTRLVFLESEHLHEPHGIDFVDDETVVVGNRGGDLPVFRIGVGSELELVGHVDDPSGLIDSPGSVAVRAREGGGHEVLVCNNWVDTITRHALVAPGLATTGEVVARAWLDLPDGLALSDDGRWLAVSNHDAHTVHVYEYPPTHEDSDPVGMLRGVFFPHGLRFADGDRRLVVADAGAPYVHVFASDGDWRGVRLPHATLQVVDDATFARGRKNPAEGGPKGLDVEQRANVLAVTLEEQPLAFFDLDAVASGGHPDGADDALMEYELRLLSEARERTAQAEARVERAQAALAEVLATKAWRLTAPARRARALLGRARR